MSSISVGKYISCIYRYSQRYFEKQLAEYGLGSGTYPFLITLFRKDGIHQQQLSQHLNIDKTTTTRAVKRLIDLGYVIRQRDLCDRRAYRLFLTEKGRRLEPGIRKVLRHWSSILSKGFAAEEKQQMLDFLRRMSHNSRHYHLLR